MWVTRIQTYKKSHSFEAFHTISIISRLSALKLALDINEIHEGAAMWLFRNLMWGSPAAAPNARLCLKPTSSSKTSRANEGLSRTYPEVVHDHLQTYSTREFSAEADATIRRYIQLSYMTPTQYPSSLATKSLWCGKSYEDYVLKWVFIEGLHEPIRHGIRFYWSTHAGAKWYNLIHHATLLRALQKGKEVTSDEGSDHRRNSKHCRFKRGNSLRSVIVGSKTELDRTLTATTTPTICALVARSSGLRPQLQQTAVKPSSSGFTPISIDQVQYCLVSLEKFCCQAQFCLPRIIFDNDSSHKESRT